MVAWYWLIGTAVLGFVFCAFFVGGRLADLERFEAYWRDQCLKLCIRHKDTMPVGPEEE